MTQYIENNELGKEKVNISYGCLVSGIYFSDGF